MLNRRESVDMPWESQGRNADLESTLLTVHKSTKVDIDSGSTGTTLVGEKGGDGRELPGEWYGRCRRGAGPREWIVAKEEGEDQGLDGDRGR